MKVLVAVGTRPEAIKMAPVIFELERRGIKTVLCSTGQHEEMLQQVFELFDIRPKIELNVMKKGQSLNELASKILKKFDRVISEVEPDWLLVQGDTTTAICAALAAFYKNIKIGHIEAGLRTGNLSSPFPEEGNRSLIARIATYHFAPTAKSKAALISEGINSKNIFITGNTVVDAINWTLDNNVKMRNYECAIPKNINLKSFILVTCHRRENMGPVLNSICTMLKDLASMHKDIDWVIPVHLNPDVKKTIHSQLAGYSNIKLIEPMNYGTTLAVIKRSIMVITDSGGIQEEAPSFGVPTVVMRNHTERTEGIDSGFSTLAGQNTEKIKSAVLMWLNSLDKYNKIRGIKNPYGDGEAARRIVSALTGESFTQFNN